MYGKNTYRTSDKELDQSTETVLFLLKAGTSGGACIAKEKLRVLTPTLMFKPDTANNS